MRRSDGLSVWQGPAPPVPVARHRYNERLPGVYGEFGSGSGLQAFYVLTALSPGQLRKVSLVKDIAGSERWRVRDLFQREVDDARVSRGLVPYLSDLERIKFFNSLILTVLPMEEGGNGVLAQMPRVVERVEEQQGQRRISLEREGYFRVRVIEDHPEYAELEWNSDTSRVVAIDGQHRLSALKRLYAARSREGLAAARAESGAGRQGAGLSSGRSFLDWRIPCVVVSFRVAGVRKSPPRILEVVRNIFVDVNTKAQIVGEARKVLLNDESVNAVAAQEVLERAHSNDLTPRHERRRETTPLLMFDWRGLEKDGEAVPSPAALKSVVEVRDWFNEYLLGEDFSEYQADRLGIIADPRFDVAWTRQRLDYATSRLVREKVGDAAMVPALLHLLENFEPYRRYIERLRSLEDEYYSGNDLQHHAFDRLRFGSSGEETANKFEVDDVERSLLVEIERVRTECLQPAVPFDQDIGMRGVVWAFGELSWRFECEDWMDYAEWFTFGLNLAYEGGWLDPAFGHEGHGHLRHVIVDHNGNVTNYRLKDARGAFGPYVALVVGSLAEPPDLWGADWNALYGTLLEAVTKTIVRGYKKEERPKLLPSYPQMGKPLTAAVKAAATKRAGRQVRRFAQALIRAAERSA